MPAIKRAPTVPVVDPDTAPPELAVLRQIVERVRDEKPGVACVLEHGVPLEVNETRVILAFEPQSFLSLQASEPEAVEALQKAARAHFSETTKVMLDVSATNPDILRRHTIVAVDEALRVRRIAAARARIEEHALVKAAIDIFGAELRDIKIASE